MDLLPRLAASRVREALGDTRVVLLAGPRQSGKTTLARALASEGRTYLTLDDATTLAAAQSDPMGPFGAVLYDHDQPVPFGEDLAAVPLSALWG